MMPNCPSRLVLLLILSLVACQATAEEIRWHRNVNQAWAAAIKKKRPLLVVFTVPGCHYCAKLKKETLSNPTIAARVNGQFEPVRIDGSRHPGLMKKLGVNAYPTMILLTPAGVVASRIEGFETPNQLNPKLLAALKKTRVAQVP